MNYYELEPQSNHFNEVFVDITHRCNMTCKNCYVPNRDIPDIDIEKALEAISKFPKKVMIRIAGAEPTMSPSLPIFIKHIREMGHRATILTNGLRLANIDYLKTLREHRLSQVYLSLNGVDNDDWYEQIDEMRCAKKKMQALDNLVQRKMILDTGTIIVKGINDDAPSRLINVLKSKGINNVTCRIKNVGFIGRSIYDSETHQTSISINTNYNMTGLIKLMSQQTGLSEDYLEYWRNKKIYQNNDVETDTFMFPLDPNSESKNLYRSGIWFKITNWDTTSNVDGVPLSNSVRRGRLTPDFKVAPFFEHVKLNEGGY